MVTFTALIEKFGKMGEKTGWTYIEIPQRLASKIKPGVRTSYRVKGSIDGLKIQKAALLPMGEGGFILPLNAAMRKMIRKREGEKVIVKMEEDKSAFEMNPDLMACLADDPDAMTTFKKLPGSHQRYFSKWIDSAKTDATKTKRIAMAVSALGRGWGFVEMMRAAKKQ